VNEAWVGVRRNKKFYFPFFLFGLNLCLYLLDIGAWQKKLKQVQVFAVDFRYICKI
jgi:hypothetical protein